LALLLELAADTILGWAGGARASSASAEVKWPDAMLSKKRILEFQRMSDAERFELAAALSEGAFEMIESLPREERDLRWRVIRRLHDQYSERILAHLAKHDR
jgi:hypothetical protein